MVSDEAHIFIPELTQSQATESPKWLDFRTHLQQKLLEVRRDMALLIQEREKLLPRQQLKHESRAISRFKMPAWLHPDTHVRDNDDKFQTKKKQEQILMRTLNELPNLMKFSSQWSEMDGEQLKVLDLKMTTLSKQLAAVGLNDALRLAVELDEMRAQEYQARTKAVGAQLEKPIADPGFQQHVKTVLANKIHHSWQMSDPRANRYKPVRGKYAEGDEGDRQRQVDQEYIAQTKAKFPADMFPGKWKETSQGFEVDIMNLKNEELSEDQQRENNLAAELAFNLVHTALEAGRKVDWQLVEELAEQIHIKWLERNWNWIKDSQDPVHLIQKKPYSEMDEQQRNKDREHIILALETYAEMSQGVPAPQSEPAQFPLPLKHAG
ncbi:MAG TPA: hypothetical protein VD999_01670 [Vitreimonas sp.]|nr:hypothetical protein [Vitreimonas sp.]